MERQLDRPQELTFTYGRRRALGIGTPYWIWPTSTATQPSLTRHPMKPIDEDPARVAEIAARLGRDADAHHWLTIAAEAGDVESIQTLIESYDKDRLGALLDVDLPRPVAGYRPDEDDMRAYHDGGPQADQEYDDDFGGAAYVAGREAINSSRSSAEADGRQDSGRKSCIGSSRSKRACSGGRQVTGNAGAAFLD
jgi:hypothetical protein